MALITRAWLEERGLLHDARVVTAHVEGAQVHISIDDEWANEHDGSDGRCAGTLAFHDADVLEGDVSAVREGWISEVEHSGGAIIFTFCDRDRLVIRSSSATWDPDGG